MKSIIHDKKDRTCYLCMMLHGDYAGKTTQEHHVVFGAGRRKLSEKYGLKVYLCIHHHTAGAESVHHNRKLDEMLRQQAQEEFERRYPDQDFGILFGRNYLDKMEEPPEDGTGSGAAGFQKLKEV